MGMAGTRQYNMYYDSIMPLHNNAFAFYYHVCTHCLHMYNMLDVARHVLE